MDADARSGGDELVPILSSYCANKMEQPLPEVVSKPGKGVQKEGQKDALQPALIASVR